MSQLIARQPQNNYTVLKCLYHPPQEKMGTAEHVAGIGQGGGFQRGGRDWDWVSHRLPGGVRTRPPRARLEDVGAVVGPS